MVELLSQEELPPDFEYPPEFIRVVELGIVNIEPWEILSGRPLRLRNTGLKERYPNRILVPFADRQDNDDVACWEIGVPGVVVIHDFASPGWEARESFASFYEWLRRAIEDLIEFDA